MLSTQPWGRRSSPAPLTLTGHGSLPRMGSGLSLCGSRSDPPAPQQGLAGMGFCQVPAVTVFPPLIRSRHS